MIIEVVGKEIEKIKGDFESYLNGLNMVGEISYSQYLELYDEGTKQIQKAYELGKSELEKENAELEKACDETQELLDKQIEATYKLDKENAELKEELKDANEKVVHLACNQNKDLKRKINKEKELLKQFLSYEQIPRDCLNERYRKFLEEVEQFISEVENDRR